jgi:long-chain acyl-CoA synthetase
MAETTEDDVLTMVYTSGTTGPPKGAMLKVSNVEYCIKVLVEGGGFASPPPSPSDVMLSYLPLCHVAERVFTTWFSASAGIQVHFAESIETVQHNLREVQPTILFGVPRIWEKMLAGVRIRIDSANWLKRVSGRFWLRVADGIAETLVRTGGTHTASTRVRYAIGWIFYYRALQDRIGVRKVRHAVSAAAPIAPDVLRFFMGIGVPMHEAYGMTENTAVATANKPGRVKLGTVGEPHDGIELRIDETTGEILTRHPGTFAGYWKNPEATAKTIDADGWLHTGDVGTVDEAGNLKITDRLKDMYICGGFNVYPAEIEQVLARLDGVVESAVIGVPDERLGEVGKAFIVTKPGFDLDEEAVIAYTREHLANFKTPRSVEFLDVLPRNPGGKVVKPLLRERS